jgi:hypothetical protein
MAKSLKMTYREDLILGGAIPAFRKPELIGIFKWTFRGLKNIGKSI